MKPIIVVEISLIILRGNIFQTKKSLASRLLLTTQRFWCLGSERASHCCACAMAGLSVAEEAKRALVTLLLSLSRAYGVQADVTRESLDAAVEKAFRKVSRKVHPDKGGSAEDSQKLNAARDAWQAALRGPPRARPRPAAAPAGAVAEPRGFREAVLLHLAPVKRHGLRTVLCDNEAFLQTVRSKRAMRGDGVRIWLSLHLLPT